MIIRIAIIGIDGSGKSTISSSVREALINKGLRIRISHYNFSLLDFLPSKITQFFRTKAHNISKHSVYSSSSKSLTVVNSSSLFYPAVFNGILSSWIDTIRHRNLDYVIHDRYYYDSFFHYSGDNINWIKRLLISLISRPKYIFYLDIDPQIAFQRKKESTIDELIFLKNKYDKLLTNFKYQDIYTLDTHKSVNQITEDIMGVIYE
jgi:thymidylate kinase